MTHHLSIYTSLKDVMREAVSQSVSPALYCVDWPVWLQVLTSFWTQFEVFLGKLIVFLTSMKDRDFTVYKKLSMKQKKIGLPDLIRLYVSFKKRMLFKKPLCGYALQIGCQLSLRKFTAVS